ncbi:AtpZ/AtpI family protein [Heliorestis convoluta]|uniref:AtpZ/AtpI family protein n=1 Tax=Heliorestis convoluta TaxID=356322 RepID=A0A5Q2N4B2_9FIRM|nr:AtpZ/AtpI family protein [Heliorestis convoluta]QGG47100.1 AtpZ/AtpI family protein [Heliorestis convoluta]
MWDNESPKHRPRQVLKAIGIGSSIGVELAVAVYLGFAAGRYGDSRLGTDPWLMLIGVLLGIVIGFFGVYYLIKNFYREGITDEEDAGKG